MPKNVIIIACVSILVVILAVLVYSRRKKEAYCGTCQGIGRKVCPNRELIHQLYNQGALTEFSPPPVTQNSQNNQWPETSWDIFFNQQNQTR